MRIKDYLGGSLSRQERIHVFWLCIYYIICTGCLSFSYWEESRLRHLTYAYGALIVLLLFFKRKSKSGVCQIFRRLVLLVTFLPFLSLISIFLQDGVSVGVSSVLISGNLLFLLYFVLHHYRVSEASLLRFFMYFSIVFATIQIVQQFTYPEVYFGIRLEETMYEMGWTEFAEMRNGLWRFRINGGNLTPAILFCVWVWLKKHFNLKLTFLFLLFCTSMYIMLTRQVIVSCLLTLFMAFFMDRELRFRDILLCGVIIIGVYLAYDALWSTLAEQTQEEANDKNIRILAASYFLEQSFRSPFSLLAGFGDQSGRLGSYLQQTLHFFPSDVGFIGQIYKYGLPYTIVCYVLMWRIFANKSKAIPLYIRLFVVYSVLMSIMIFPFQNTQKGVWAMLLYICDLHIGNSPLALNTTKTN